MPHNEEAELPSQARSQAGAWEREKSAVQSPGKSCGGLTKPKKLVRDAPLWTLRSAKRGRKRATDRSYPIFPRASHSEASTRRRVRRVLYRNCNESRKGASCGCGRTWQFFLDCRVLVSLGRWRRFARRTLVDASLCEAREKTGHGSELPNFPSRLAERGVYKASSKASALS